MKTLILKKIVNFEIVSSGGRLLGMFKRTKIILGVVLGIVAYLWAVPYFVISSQKAEIYYVAEDVVGDYEVGIVFGAGVKPNGEPSDVLKDRLVAASELYHVGAIEKIFVSGDNRFESYSEPDAMKEYLVGVLDVVAEDIIADFAGRRTYDTCARASKVWLLDSAVLITQEYHLPRAMFLCEFWGIENVGYSSTRQPYVKEDWMMLREMIAIHWAVFDAYLLRPDYVGGPIEEDFVD